MSRSKAWAVPVIALVSLEMLILMHGGLLWVSTAWALTIIIALVSLDPKMLIYIHRRR